MPKPKATEVIVHRIDLQPSMKESMDAFLIGKTATNALQGVGTILSAFGPALGAIAAAWIAKEGIEGAIDAATNYFEKKGEEIVEAKYGDEMQKYQLVCATLESCANLADLEAQSENLNKTLRSGEPPALVGRAWTRFVSKGHSSGYFTKTETQWGKPMVNAWMSFYPISTLGQEMKAHALEYAKKRSRNILARVLFPISNLWLD